MAYTTRYYLALAFAVVCGACATLAAYAAMRAVTVPALAAYTTPTLAATLAGMAGAGLALVLAYRTHPTTRARAWRTMRRPVVRPYRRAH